MASEVKVRLQRFLAQAGVASRRRSEELIQAGKVKVNNKVVKELGTRVDPRRDRVYYAGRRVLPEEHVWLLLNKPDGTVSTVSDPEGRQTVMDIIGPQHVRLYPVGRLDYHTQGALLLTNDGDLANALSHPRGKLPRVYHVKLRGDVNPDDMDTLRQGVTLDTGETVKAQVAILGTTGLHTWIEMTLTQGLNRQVHRMVDCIGGTVLKLTRVAYGPLTVEDLPPGKNRLLGQTEIDKLRSAVNLSGQTRRDREKPGRRAPARQEKPGGHGKIKPGTDPTAWATAKPRGSRAGRPGARTARPGARGTKPKARTARPGARATKPDARATKPGARATKPDARATKPGARTTKPDARATKPGARTARPGARATKPKAWRPGMKTGKPISRKDRRKTGTQKPR